MNKMSNLQCKCKKHLRGADGIRTRSFCLRHSRSTVSLPPQLTEAKLVYHILLGQIVTAAQVKTVMNDGALRFGPVTGSP